MYELEFLSQIERLSILCTYPFLVTRVVLKLTQMKKKKILLIVASFDLFLNDTHILP